MSLSEALAIGPLRRSSWSIRRRDTILAGQIRGQMAPRWVSTPRNRELCHLVRRVQARRFEKQGDEFPF
jgi:hypothetical protein